ncbi:alpha/beta hydrolase [bacterium]
MIHKYLHLLIWLSVIPFHLLGQNYIVPLWPEGPPGAIPDSTYIEFLDTDKPHRIRNVSDPTLSIYLPSEHNTECTAIVICPGGGYRRLAMDIEGFEVAKWLNTMGIAGIILKYRLPDDRIMKDKSIGPLQDVQEAIRSVRRNALEWRIDPQKIGVIGFSAGGHLAATASTLYDDIVYELIDSVSARPDFSVLIYPVISFRDSVTHTGSRSQLLGESPTNKQIHQFSADEQVNEETPPAFLVHSINDEGVSIQNSLNYFKALRNNNVPCELHFFESGGHGYGINQGKGSEANWPETLYEWLKMHGWD